MKQHGCIFLIGIALFGCDAPKAPGLDLSFLRASGRTGACSAQGTALTTHELRWLQLTMDGVDGRAVDILTPSSLDTHRLDLDEIPIGEGWTLTVNGYRNTPEAQAGKAWWRATAVEVATRADAILELDLLFSRPNQPDCARGGPDRGVAFATLTPLPDGRALLAGGISEITASDACEGCRQGEASRASWIYNPQSSTFQRTGDLPMPQAGHQAVLMDDGRVLVVGGARRLTLGGAWPVAAEPGDLLEAAALWDPRTGQWAQVLGAPPRLHHSLHRVGRTELIVAGGVDATGEATSELVRLEMVNGELLGSESRTVDMGCARAGHRGLQEGNEIILFGGEVCGEPQGPQRFRAGQITELSPSSWDASANTFFGGHGRLADGSWALLGGLTRTADGFRAPARSSSYLYMPSDNRLLRAPRLPEEAAVLYPAVLSVEGGQTVILTGGFRDLTLTTPSATVVRYDDRTEESRRTMPVLKDPDGQVLELSRARGGTAFALVGDHIVFAGGLINCLECPGGQGSSTLTELYLPEGGR